MSDKIKTPAEQVNSLVNQICSNYESQIEKLKKENKFFEAFSPAEKLISYPYEEDKSNFDPANCYWDTEFKPEHLINSYYSGDKRPDFIKKGWTIEKCENLIKTCNEISLKNKEIIARNKEKYDIIKSLFQKLGFNSSRRERDYKSKARYIKYIDVSTGVYEELSRVFPMYDSWDSKQNNLKEYIEKINKYNNSQVLFLKNEEDAKRRQQEKVEQEKQQKEYEYLLIELNVKYKLGLLPPELDEYSVKAKFLDDVLFYMYYNLTNNNLQNIINKFGGLEGYQVTCHRIKNIIDNKDKTDLTKMIEEYRLILDKQEKFSDYLRLFKIKETVTAPVIQ